jgi:putative lipoic acid-binding regulatory protein
MQREKLRFPLRLAAARRMVMGRMGSAFRDEVVHIISSFMNL